MKIITTPFYGLFLSIIVGAGYFNVTEVNKDNLEQARQNAVRDFSKTKLFTIDSVFSVSLRDTIYRLSLKKLGEHHYEWVRAKTYANMIALTISGCTPQFPFDTTMRVDKQTKIPSRVIEKSGRIFYRWDDSYPLTDSTLKLLDKHQLILRRRGEHRNKFRYPDFDELKKGAHYYFCRSNPSIYKEIVTNSGIGYYDPPKLACK